MPDPFLQFLRTRSREHFDQVFKAHAGSVSRFLRRLLPAAAAEETAQEVFLQLASMRRAPEQITNAKAFILGVALRVAKDRVRADRTRIRHEMNAGRLRRVTCPAASESAMLQERVDQILTAIDALPETLRLPVHLRAVEGLTYRQISKVLGISMETVAVRILRARKKLRKSLGATFGLTWLVGLPWQTEGRAFAASASGGPPLTSSAVLRAASRASKARLSLGLGIICACIAVLGFFSPRGDPQLQARGVVAVHTGLAAQGSARSRSIPAQFPRSPPKLRRVAQRPSGTSIPGNIQSQQFEAEAAFSNAPIPHSGFREGVSDMSLRASPLASAFLALALASASQGAEPGDRDGDGRVSLSDVVGLFKGSPAAPGSMELLNSVCHGSYQGAALWLEDLRRSVEGSYPNWVAIDPRWTAITLQPPLEVLPNPPFVLSFEPMTASGGDNDQLLLNIHLTVFEPISAFNLILEGEGGILEAPFRFHEECSSYPWEASMWQDPFGLISCFGQVLGDLPTSVSPAASLITGGRYVITRRGLAGDNLLDDPFVPISPGEYSITTMARLPIGTSAGEYTVRLHPGSEVLIDGEPGLLTAPLAVGDGKVVVEREVTTGFDGRPPKFQFDRESRRISGKVEYRLVDQLGIPGTKESPVVAGLPGQEITFRVQLRTEVPLNELRYAVIWPSFSLDCSNLLAESLLTNPEDGWLYASYPIRPDFDAFPTCQEVGGLEQLIRLAGAWSYSRAPSWLRHPPEVNYIERIFEYIKPLGEWTDVSQTTVRIPATATGGSSIPLNFARYSRTNYEVGAHFVPYSVDWPCFPPPANLLWSYDIDLHDTFVRVLGENEPPPPPDLGIRIALGDAEGRPGEQVELSIIASSDVALSRLRIVATVDSESLFIEGVVTHVKSDLTGDYQDVLEVPGGLGSGLSECIDTDGDEKPDTCYGGAPLTTVIEDTQLHLLVIDWLLPALDSEPTEIARLLVRISSNPTSPVLHLDSTRETFVDHFAGGFEIDGESGGWSLPLDSPIFSPVHAAFGGEVRVTGFVGLELLRGDTNADSKVDLSDAVSTLGYLFLGNTTLLCLDAADTDDSGKVEITDAIFLLGALFLGTNTIPAPYPDCGADPTVQNGLGCGQGCQ